MSKKDLLSFINVVVLVTCFACQSPSPSPNPSESSASQSTNVETIPTALPTGIEPGRLAWQKPELVIDQLGDITDKVIADMRAGSGFFAFRMVNAAKRVIAIDSDPEMIKFMKGFSESLKPENQKKFETRLAQDQVSTLSDGEADLILVINNIGFIADRPSYLSTLKSALSENGQLAIVDFKMKRIPNKIAPRPANRVNILDLENELEEVGYNLIKTNDTSLEYQYIIIAEKE